jgi:glyoxylase-like metal-dependent hydrolase (beta-lactamase superfamily II)
MPAITGFEMLEVPADLMGTPSAIYPTLIWDHDQRVLVDTGFPGQLPRLNAAIERAGFSLDQLTTLILTHHDIDHIGGLAEIVRRLQGQVKVLAHQTEKAYIQGDKTPLKLAQFEANQAALTDETRLLVTRLKAGFERSYAPVDETLEDGQILPYLNGVTVIFTPGHTLGHICLYLQGFKTLIAGDLLRVEDGELSLTLPSINYDNELAKKSLKALIPFDIETVICYHGGAFKGDANWHIAGLIRQQEEQ